MIIMNPPYIKETAELEADVKDYEPHSALYGGTDGLDVIKRLFRGLGESLSAEGKLVMEIGFDQYADIMALTEATAGVRMAEVLKDLSGHRRTVVVEKIFG